MPTTRPGSWPKAARVLRPGGRLLATTLAPPRPPRRGRTVRPSQPRLSRQGTDARWRMTAVSTVHGVPTHLARTQAAAFRGAVPAGQETMTNHFPGFTPTRRPDSSTEPGRTHPGDRRRHGHHAAGLQAGRGRLPRRALRADGYDGEHPPEDRARTRAQGRQRPAHADPAGHHPRHPPRLSGRRRRPGRDQYLQCHARSASPTTACSTWCTNSIVEGARLAREACEQMQADDTGQAALRRRRARAPPAAPPRSARTSIARNSATSASTNWRTTTARPRAA